MGAAYYPESWNMAARDPKRDVGPRALCHGLKGIGGQKTERSGAVDRIADLENGFEGWIKLEFLFWLRSHRTPALPAGSAGLEYKLALDQRHREMDRATKRCDVWVRSTSPNLFHYVELKAPFFNGNAGKVLDSAAADFWYMARIRATYEQAASGNAIVLGVRFSDDGWRQGVERLRRVTGLPDEMALAGSGVLGGSIRWCVLTRTYSSAREAGE